MKELTFNRMRCDLCGRCIDSCPFGAMEQTEQGIVTTSACRMCGACTRVCPKKAIRMEEVQVNGVDKNEWKDFLIYVEVEHGDIHPVAFELIGEARKMAAKVQYKVKCIIIGPEGTKEISEKLLEYGVDEVYVYEDETFAGFKADSYAEAFADCIATTKPSSVLIGATSLGRSLAPRLATRFHTGLTADCTTLDIQENSDMIQIRPAFGGNIMAQIMIANTRPQFATVRYRVMDKAEKVDDPQGVITLCKVTPAMRTSGIEVLSSTILEKKNSIEDAEIIVAIGRGVSNEEGVLLCKELADSIGATLAYTRPMIEQGIGDQAYQIGLSGHTVRPKLIITCGISGAIQFTSCMNASETIVAINKDPNAQIFGVASYCIIDDLYEVVPGLTQLFKEYKEEN